MSSLLESLVDFAGTITGEFDISDVLNDLADRVPAVLGIAGAEVSLVSEGRVLYATANSELSATLERTQVEHQAGPCVEAITSGEDVALADIGSEAARWPDYVAAAAECGIVAVAALPMRHRVTLGAFDLYDTRVHAWTAEELTIAHVYANIATAYLLNASELERERRTVEQLQSALDSRVVIEQAKGMIASTHGVSIDAGFKRLRTYARDHRASLADVANAVVSLELRV